MCFRFFVLFMQLEALDPADFCCVISCAVDLSEWRHPRRIPQIPAEAGCHPTSGLPAASPPGTDMVLGGRGLSQAPRTANLAPQHHWWQPPAPQMCSVSHCPVLAGHGPWARPSVEAGHNHSLVQSLSLPCQGQNPTR